MKRPLIIGIMVFVMLFSACGDANSAENALPQSSTILGYSHYRTIDTWTLESEGCKFLVVQNTSNWNLAISQIGKCE